METPSASGVRGREAGRASRPAQEGMRYFLPFELGWASLLGLSWLLRLSFDALCSALVGLCASDRWSFDVRLSLIGGILRWRGG
jgi:hypothetical protein